MIGFVTMGLAATATFAGSGDAGLAPALRYGAVLLFSGVGGLIPATLFALAVRLAPGEGTLGDDGRLGPAVVGARPVRRAAAGGRGRERRGRLAVDVGRHGRVFCRRTAADGRLEPPAFFTPLSWQPNDGDRFRGVKTASVGGFRRCFPSCL